MKFVPDQMDVPAITAHGPGWVAVNGQPFRHHLLLTAQGLLQPWHCTGFDQLDTGHFSQLAELPCELCCSAPATACASCIPRSRPR